jgi:iron complex outermembrane receptor protein
MRKLGSRAGAGALGIAIVAATAAYAEDPTPPPAGDFPLGEVVVVSGKRPPQESVDQQQMRRADAGTVSQAADLLPGTTLARGGARNESLLYVHGFDLKHVPLFLDGIPVYVPYDGYPDLGRFYTYDLSRVVVSRGFTSVLYGPNTMGGAINLVTRRPERALEGDAGARLTTDWTRTAWANVGARQSRFYEQLSGSWERSDGFQLSDRYRATPAEDGGQRENAYHRDWKLSGKIGWTPRESDEYALGVSLQRGGKGSPPYAGTAQGMGVKYWRWPYWDKQSVYLATHTALGEASEVDVRLYRDGFQNSLYAYDDATYTTISKRSSFKSQYDDYTYGGSVKASTRPFEGNTLRAALHAKVDVHQEHNLPNPWQHFEDQILSAGLEDTHVLAERVRLVGGVSFDRLETVRAQDYSTGTMVDFERGSTAAWNPQLGVFVSALPGAEVHAAVARKSRLPSIKDKYSYRLGTAIPNPDLRPEYAVNYELGWDHQTPLSLRYSALAFFHDVSDYVQAATVPDPADATRTTTQNQNLGKVRQWGLEALVAYARGDELDAGATYTYLRAENRSNDQKLTNVPAHKVTAYLRVSPWKLLQGYAWGEWYSRRYSSSDGKRVAAGFAVVNLKVMSEPAGGLLVEAGVENLFDRDYGLEEGFPEPGRTFTLDARYRF